MKLQGPDNGDDTKGVRLNRDSVKRILDEVGKKFVPCDLDQQRLLRTLQFCDTTWRKVYADLRKTSIKDRRRRFDRISHKAKQLKELLSDQGSFRLFRAGKDLVEALNEFLDADPEDPSSDGPPSSNDALEKQAASLMETWRTRSETEWLAGDRLPSIFKTFFGSPPGRSWNNGRPGGPCVRFVHASLKEMGLEYERSSIMRAMTDARKRPQTRRPR